MSRHHRAAKWSTKTKTLRPRIAATLPRPCVECGKPVLPGQAWDVAHHRDLALGGDVRSVGPAHRSCNRAAGGRLGAALSKAPTTVEAPTREGGW